MRIDVALVPSEARRWTGTVCILLDELRASSTIVILLERGAEAVLPAASIAEARRLAAAEGALLAGEHHVVRAPGFEYGNEPAQIAAANLAGRRVVLSTRNGTAVLRALPAAAPVVVGCLLNARAVAEAALAMAREREADIGIVCAGRRGAFAIDDAIAAGCILERLLAAAGADLAGIPTVDGHLVRGAPRADVGSLAVTDAALASIQLWRSTPDVAAAFRSSWSGHLLAGVGLLADLDASLPVDASTVVPVLVRGEPSRIVRQGR